MDDPGNSILNIAAGDLLPVDKKALRFEWVTAEQVKPNALNWRVHPEKQSTALNKLIFSKQGVGWAGVLLINDRREIDGWDAAEAVWTLVDGHDRHRLAAVHGQPAPAVIGHWTPEQERVILATLDPIAALADTNPEAWGSLLQSVESADNDIKTLLDDLSARAGVFAGVDFGDLPPIDEDQAENKKDFAITIIIRQIDQFETIAESIKQLIAAEGWDVELKA